MSYNLFLRAINDAIKEGDGERLFEMFRIAVLYFKCYKRNKYAYTVLKSLFRVKMEPSAAFSIIWERFINTRGMRGFNISMDLHMEHLNNFLKELLRDLRSNLNQANADRVAKSMNNLRIIVQNFEKENGINQQRSSRNKAKVSEDVKNLCTKFMEQNIFSEEDHIKKSYESFPKFNDQTLAKLKIDKLLKWAKEKKTEYQILYERT